MSEAILVKSVNVTKGYVDTNLNTKVDKVAGKGLSTNDYNKESKSAAQVITCDYEIRMSLYGFISKFLSSFFDNVRFYKC